MQDAYVIYQTLAELAELRDTGANFVPGDGPVPSRVMFIGEAPGRNEDSERRPFVGQSGMYLDYLLDTIGLERAGVFVTNIVKYRPPGNRDPKPDEIRVSLDCLRAEILAVQPEIVVTLGRHALYAIFPDFSKTTLRELHGQPFTYRSRLWFPTYHPSAALRNAIPAGTMEQDFQTLGELLK